MKRPSLAIVGLALAAVACGAPAPCGRENTNMPAALGACATPAPRTQSVSAQDRMGPLERINVRGGGVLPMGNRRLSLIPQPDLPRRRPVRSWGRR